MAGGATSSTAPRGGAPAVITATREDTARARRPASFLIRFRTRCVALLMLLAAVLAILQSSLAAGAWACLAFFATTYCGIELARGRLDSAALRACVVIGMVACAGWGTWEVRSTIESSPASSTRSERAAWLPGVGHAVGSVLAGFRALAALRPAPVVLPSKLLLQTRMHVNHPGPHTTASMEATTEAVPTATVAGASPQGGANAAGNGGLSAPESAASGEAPDGSEGTGSTKSSGTPAAEAPDEAPGATPGQAPALGAGEPEGEGETPGGPVTETGGTLGPPAG